MTMMRESIRAKTDDAFHRTFLSPKKKSRNSGLDPAVAVLKIIPLWVPSETAVKWVQIHVFEDYVDEHRGHTPKIATA